MAGRSASNAGSKALSVAILLLWHWPKGLWLHTRLVLCACAAVIVR